MIAILAATFEACAVTKAQAVGSASETSPPAIVYRQIMVPANHLEAGARDGEKYLPIETEDFQVWVARANSPAAGRGAQATLTDAQYHAQFDGEELLGGSATWSIDLGGERPILLPLDGISLAASKVRWREDVSRKVRLGHWGRSGEAPTGRALEVERSGVLEFEWRAAAESASQGVEFAWRVPRAATARLTLDLPEQKRPVLEGSVLLGSQTLPGESQETPDGSARRWLFALGPATSVLRIVDTAGAAGSPGDDAAQNGSASSSLEAAPTRATGENAASQAMLVREELRYAISDRGLDISARLEIDPGASELREIRELSLPLAADVQLLAAEWGDQPLAWRIVGDDESAGRRALVQLPEEYALEPGALILRGWQPLVAGRPWRLPKLRPFGVAWTAGSVELTIEPTLELRSLMHADAVQTSVSPGADDGTSPHRLELTPYSPRAQVEVLVGPSQPRATARLGTTLRVSDLDVTARLVTRWQMTTGQLHTLQADLEPGWIVDSVETVPSDALHEWFLDRKTSGLELRLQLAQAARPGGELAVIVTGRWQRSGWLEPLSADVLRVLSWREARATRHLALIQTVDPYTVHSRGGVASIVPSELDDADRTLFEEATDQPVFDVARMGAGDSVRLSVEAGDYEAQIDLTATVFGSQLREVYRLTGRPRGRRINNVLIYSAEPLGDDVQWSETVSGIRLAAERLTPSEARRRGLPPEGELWQIRLPRPVDGDIQIEGVREWPLADSGPLPLLSLPHAASQQGRIIVRGDAAGGLWVKSTGLQPSPLPPESADSAESRSPIRAAFRYDPATLVERESRARLWLGKIEPAAGAGVPFARRVDLESFFAASGRAVHRVIYHLEAGGAGALRILLPATAQSVTATLNGAPINANRSDRPGEVNVVLPGGQGESQLSLSFQCAASPLHVGAILSPPLDEKHLAMLGGEWTVWLPEGFRAAGAGSPAEPTFQWRRRLFGPFGRSADDDVFNPLAASHWATRWPAWGGSIAVAADGTSVAGKARPGWHRVQKPFVAQGPLPLRVEHPPSISTWSLCAFLIALVAGVKLRSRRRERFVLATAVAAALCLLLPEIYAPIATGTLLGLVFSLLYSVARLPATYGRPASPSRWSSTRSTATAGAGAAGVICLAVILLASGLRAEPLVPAANESTAESLARAGGELDEGAPPEQRLERVLIPTDQAGQPTGSKVYISERFLRRLLQEAHAETSSGDWLLRGAAYHATLGRRGDGEDRSEGTWTATFDLEVLSRDTTVQLPLERAEAAWAPEGMLDGIPAPLQWREDGRGCSITVREPGRYSLKISFAPHAEEAAGHRSIRLTLPPVSGAALRIDAPNGLSPIRAIGAVDVRRSDESDREPLQTGVENATRAGARFAGELDGSGRLEVSWPITRATNDSSAVVGISELCWLHVGPEGIELELKYLIPDGAGLTEPLRISADSEWELIDGGGTDAGDTDAGETRTGRDRFEVDLAIPAPGDARREAVARFRLRSAPSFGRWRLPPVELATRPVASRSVAVSTDASVSCEIVAGERGRVETADEFLARWGAAGVEQPPQLIRADLSPGDNWRLAIAPRIQPSVIHDLVHLSTERERLRVAYQVDVQPGQPHQFRFQFSIPAELSIDELTLEQGGERVGLRWIRMSDTRLNVFFDRRVRGPYRIALVGHLPVSDTGTTPLPRIAEATQEAAVHRLQLYRDEAVLVEMAGLAEVDLSPEAPVELSPFEEDARLLGVYEFDRIAADSVRLVISPNRVEAVGEMLLTLVPRERHWWAIYKGRFTVRQGSLDRLQFRVPPTGIGPFEVPGVPSGHVTLTPVGREYSLLTVRLPEPIRAGEEAELEIRAPLAAGPSNDVAVPNIVPETGLEWRGYISVPAELAGQPLAWSHVGVQPSAPPEGLQPATTTSGSPGRAGADAAATAARGELTFRIASLPFVVAIERPAAPEPTASIRLADSQVIVGPAGGQYTVSRFVVAPQGIATCEVRLPTGERFVGAQVDGHRALLEPIGPGRWSLQLGSSHLPQIVEILTLLDERSADGGTVTLRRPSLLAGGRPIPVELSLWSLGHASRPARGASPEASAIPAIEQAALRLDRLISIAELATPAASGAIPPDGENWFRCWTSQLLAAQANALAQLPEEAAGRTLSQVAVPMEQRLLDASQRISEWSDTTVIASVNQTVPSDQADQADQTPQIDQVPPQLRSGPDAWSTGRQLASHWNYFVADGGGDELTVRFVGTKGGKVPSQVGGMLSIVCLAAAAIWVLQHPSASDWLWRWPHAIGVILGLLAWAWLEPGWLGLAIAAGSVLVSLRPGWPGGTRTVEGSTILQAGSRS